MWALQRGDVPVQQRAWTDMWIQALQSQAQAVPGAQEMAAAATLPRWQLSPGLDLVGGGAGPELQRESSSLDKGQPVPHRPHDSAARSWFPQTRRGARGKPAPAS